MVFKRKDIRNVVQNYVRTKKTGANNVDRRSLEAIVIKEIKAIRSSAVSEVHDKTSEPRDDFSNHVDSPKCSQCGRTFKLKRNLLIHMQTHHRTSDVDPVYRYKCYRCSKTFERTEERAEHVRLSHKNTEENVVCEKCNLRFTCTSNLYRHRKTHHPETDAVGSASPVPEDFECSICQKKFRRKDSLKRHQDAQHADADSKPQFTCDHCSRQFAAKCTLIAHIKVCKMKDPQEGKFKCLRCDSAFCNEYLVQQHYIKDHDILFVYEELQFGSYADFEAWKADMEETTVTQYCNEHGWKTRTHSTKQFKCHRSGLRLAVPDENRKRFPKLAGSKKLDGICPAQIIVRQNLEDGTCSIKYQKTHVGHNLCDQNELWYKRLSKEEARRNLRKPRTADAPSDGETETEPKTERQSRSKEDGQRRNGPTKKKPQNIIPNITVVTSLENELSENVLDDASNSTADGKLDDMSDITLVTSSETETLVVIPENVDDVRAFVETHRDSILFFKDEGVEDTIHGLEDSDLVVIYMDEFQKDLLRLYSGECVAFDVTDSSLKLHLHTMLIRDQEWEGVGVAFLLANRDSQALIEIFLTYVKRCVGLLAPSIVLSNVSMTYQTAWTEHMVKPEYSFFSSWHVNKQWEEHLNRISNREKKRALSRRLYDVAQELDPDAFDEQLQALLSDTDPDLTEFIEYFGSYCAFTTQYWAYCYRPSSGINTNINLDRLYKMITGDFAHGVRSANVDVCLRALKDYSILKKRQTERKKLRGQVYDFEKAAMLHKRHWQAERRGNITVRPVNGMTWSIQSEDDKGCVENYVVQKLSRIDACKICDENRGLLRCSRCKVCFHQFICTCRDCSMRCNMCKHIHALGLFLKDRTLAEEFIHSVDESEEEDESAHMYVVEEVMLSDDDLGERDIEDVPIVNLELQKEELLQEIVTCINDIQTEQSIEDLKKMWRKSVSSMVENSETNRDQNKCVTVPPKSEVKRRRL